MSGLPFWHIDAFADGPFTGNPAGVIRLDRWREDTELQIIAAELNLPATAFVVAVEWDADFEICWFSSHGEIRLCGHGTLAAGHALIADRQSIRFATRNAGIVTVARSGEAYSLSLPAIPVAARALPESAAALGGEPLDSFWNAAGYALIRYRDEAAIRALRPDISGLQAIGKVQHIATAPGNESDVVSRVFSAGGIEDAATGSAHAVLTPYWADRLGRPAFTAVQASARGARIGCRLDSDTAVLTSRCVTVVEGRFGL